MNSKNQIIGVLRRGLRAALIILLALSFLTTTPTRAAGLPNLELFSIVLNGGNLNPLETGRTYTIIVKNVGDVPTTGPATVVFSQVTVPAGLTVTNMAGTGWTCPPGTLTCTRADVLNNGESYPVITVTVTVLVGALPEITNQAVVSGGGADDDPNNNTSSLISNVNAKADLIITGYELRNADKSDVITKPNPNQTFWVRMTIQNQGGGDTQNFYPGVFLDDKPNYGPDHDTDGIALPPGYPTLFLGETTDYQGYKITGSTGPSGAGCVYYDPNNLITPATTEVVSERGNYHPYQFLPGLAAGATSTFDVEIAYPSGDYSDPIYDNIRTGLPSGSYLIHLYADSGCNVAEVTENNNAFGPITVVVGKVKFVVDGIWTTALNYDEGWRVNMHPRMLGDVNGDGRDDLVGFGYSGVFVGLANSNGHRFDTPTIWTTALNYDEGWRVNMHPRMLGDVNGDGKDDLVGFGYSGVFVGLANSTGNGFNTPSMWTSAFNYNEGWRVDLHPRMLGDVNGDGKDDLVGIGYSGVFVALANSAGNGFDSLRIWTSDFSYASGWRVDKHPRMLGDANGDGKEDLIGFGDDGVYVALANSAGNGFDTPIMWTSAFNYSEGWRVDMHPRTVGDVNGDGKVDLIGIGYAGTFVALANPAGNGFVVDGMWTVALNYNEGWRVDMHPRMIGDVNGDGAADLVGIGYAGVFVIRAE